MLTRRLCLLHVLLVLGCFAHATPESTSQVVIHPKEHPGALRNPLKGFRPDVGPQVFRHEYATLARCYFKWNELEDRESNGIDRIINHARRTWY